MDSGDFVDTLGQTVAALAGATDAWWIIGSTAAVLHGAETTVADVDVLCADPEDARGLLAALGGAVLPNGADALFRSAVFGRCAATPLPVEVMAGLMVRGEPVRLRTREWVRCGEVLVPVPSREELVEVLWTFGRTKDLARAALLGGEN